MTLHHLLFNTCQNMRPCVLELHLEGTEVVELNQTKPRAGKENQNGQADQNRTS